MDYNDDAKPSDFPVGSCVELHPAMDAWMRGDRFGTVVNNGWKLVHVKMDVSGRTRTVQAENLRTV